MEQKINLKTIMETKNHSKNGINVKNRMYRGNLLTKLMLLCFTLFISVGVWCQKTAEIESVWVGHNVYENNQKGMKIYIDFTVHNMLDRKGNCVAWFYFSDGTKLKDYNGQYRTTDGQVSKSEYYKPGYKDAKYTDFELFMPYDELHLSEGEFKCKFYVGIFDNNSKSMTTSEYQYFDFSK
jgi:hypothetical protein